MPRSRVIFTVVPWRPKRRKICQFTVSLTQTTPPLTTPSRGRASARPQLASDPEPGFKNGRQGDDIDSLPPPSNPRAPVDKKDLSP